MIKKMITVVSLFLVFVTTAQEKEETQETQETLEQIVNKNNENKNFIQLKSGEIFYFDSYIEKTDPFIGSSKLKVEGNEYLLKEVESYRTGTQFFMSTDDVYGACTDFAQRIDIGKINTYKSYKTVYNAGAPMMGAGGMMMGGFGGTSKKEVYYYNKGNAPLKSMNYDNLIEDLVDNQESMMLLSAHKKLKNRRTLAYVLGGAAFLVGAITGFEKTGETNTSYNFETRRNETTDELRVKPLNFGFAVAGMLTIAITSWTSKNKDRHLKSAVETYNSTGE